MDVPKVFESEYRLCLILWENEPIRSSELVQLCRERLGWKPTTTYTVIKRLSERGVLKNENSVVTSLVSKDQVQAAEIDELVEKTFEGSLPAFVAAFTKHRRLSAKEVDEVQAMIDRFREEAERNG
ncbi:BlaI/MecI/CopY family transcriptional regulator [Candidatus Allofournierella merdipullorum]|uniref:BlaI/MecI/CopY family transcriptional regulator n=1 Tax=Candidatus Allofournierella merdipullorum TaxID=2838595 RepID=UPI003AB1AF95